jgi:hypothetical protein
MSIKSDKHAPLAMSGPLSTVEVLASKSVCTLSELRLFLTRISQNELVEIDNDFVGLNDSHLTVRLERQRVKGEDVYNINIE